MAAGAQGGFWLTMSSVSTYGYVNARVRTKRGSLLSGSAYKALAAASNLPDVLNQLARLKPGTLLEQAPKHSIESLECLLIQEEVRQVMEIKKASRGQARDILAALLARVDAQNVKAILRSWQKRDKTVVGIIESPGLLALPVQEMLAAGNLVKFAGYLTEAFFYESFLNLAVAYERHQSLFEIEVGIDKSIYQALWDITAHLNQTDRHIVRRMVGIEIDLQNLDWVARIRKYYQAQLAAMDVSLIPNGYRLPQATLRRMITTGSLDEGIDRILPGIATESADTTQTEALEKLEQFLNQALHYEANRLFLEYPLSIGSSIGYYYLLRIETRNIRSLVNAKHYQLPPQKILANLVF
jgi:V/A-type H+-transporting ATPase subunit C